jgi:hypothetical protein
MHLNGPMNGFKAGPLIKESIGCAVVCATAGSIESQVNCTQKSFSTVVLASAIETEPCTESDSAFQLGHKCFFL